MVNLTANVSCHFVKTSLLHFQFLCASIMWRKLQGGKTFR